MNYPLAMFLAELRLLNVDIVSDNASASSTDLLRLLTKRDQSRSNRWDSSLRKSTRTLDSPPNQPRRSVESSVGLPRTPLRTDNNGAPVRQPDNSLPQQAASGETGKKFTSSSETSLVSTLYTLPERSFPDLEFCQPLQVII
jgi:hypothetical protein